MEEVLIAYDLQFIIAEFFANTNIMLLPDAVFIDDMDKVKSKIRFNLRTTIEKDMSKTKN